MAGLGVAVSEVVGRGDAGQPLAKYIQQQHGAEEEDELGDSGESLISGVFSQMQS